MLQHGEEDAAAVLLAPSSPPLVAVEPPNPSASSRLEEPPEESEASGMDGMEGMEGMEGNTVDVASAVALKAAITIDEELLNFMLDVRRDTHVLLFRIEFMSRRLRSHKQAQKPQINERESEREKPLLSLQYRSRYLFSVHHFHLMLFPCPLVVDLPALPIGLGRCLHRCYPF